MLYLSAINIFIMRRYAANGNFLEKIRGPAGKKARSCLENSLSVAFVLSPVPSVGVKHANLGENVRALVLLTFMDNVKKRRNLKIFSLEVAKFGNILVNITLQSLKA